ncbi:fimbrial biogenesis outer membrane usher protein [Jeongeupia wiesaeckerbachi]|uniref:fimbria/pilus outer membrane usher protein n=1 Tax=Jeongeupia wiesaeckerbachi TaxID=3051218 RepID=UPI003D80603A
MIAAYSAVARAAPAAVVFNAALVSPGIDPLRFADGNPVDPGRYSVDVFVNGRMLRRSEMQVALREQAGVQRTVILVPVGLLRAARVEPERIEAAVQATGAAAPAPITDDTLVQVDLLDDAASAVFDVNEYRLNLSLPQIVQQQAPRGYVDPAQWDPGTSGLLLNYVSSFYHGTGRGQSSDSAYVGLRAGFNLGLWQYRNTSSLSWRDGEQPRFDSTSNYLQRVLPGLMSVLRLGDTQSSARFFSSMAMTGAVLASDDRMLPDSQRGYAPVVRGVARSNARVTVRQRDSILYQTTVAPGAFEINDLYPTGYGGDLQVTIDEADGSQQRFRVPYAALPELIRPGQSRFELAAGRLKDEWLIDPPLFGEAVYQRGISNALTASVGAQAGEGGYLSGVTGLAYNTGWGALSSDVTVSHMLLDGEARDGWSWRVAFSKYLQQTGTNLSLAAYRYSSSGFSSLRDAAYLQQASQTGRTARPAGEASTVNQRHSLQLYLNQTIGKNGSLYASGSLSDYWGASGTGGSVQIGYSETIGGINYSVNLSRSYDVALGESVNQVYVGLSIPLGSAASAVPLLNTAVTHDDRGNTGVQANLSGMMPSDTSLSYSAFATANASDGGERNSSVGGSLSRTTRAGLLQASASYGGGYTQASVGMSGSMLAHSGGLTFGQYTGDTVGLIEAEGAEGATVDSRSQVVVDGNGYAIVPSLSPYRENEIALNPRNASDEVELLDASRRVVPYDGAVVKLQYATQVGKPTLLVLLLDDTRVPLGALARDAAGRMLGIVGGEGRLLLRDLPATGTVSLHWGERGEQQCRFELATLRQPGAAPADSGGMPIHAVRCTSPSTASSLPVLPEQVAPDV